MNLLVYFQVRLVCVHEHLDIKNDIIKSVAGAQQVKCADQGSKTKACSCFLNRKSSSERYEQNPGTSLYQKYINTHSKWNDFSFIKQEDGCLLSVNGEDDEKFEITAMCGEE